MNHHHQVGNRYAEEPAPNKAFMLVMTVEHHEKEEFLITKFKEKDVLSYVSNLNSNLKVQRIFSVDTQMKLTELQIVFDGQLKIVEAK